MKVRRQKKKVKRILKLILLFPSYFLLTPYAQACPTCNDLVGRGVDAFKTMKFGEGIAWSMIPLFGVPFLMAGTLIFIIVRASKKSKESNDNL